ncbi:toll/il-1 receptor-like protein [Raccoonpox virus]|uniref:Toll/IL1-receptor [TIR]-like protein n=1 Tax=Raccoon poxvirus TaxID=10256 RepID=A0A0G3FXX6_RACVI|nr:Toll/IL1-receptor [TIR]-like protein [Raccoonpox virus]AKJ93803.1 Toll/IL1-receptor [TIR]-like protein [Raccoonpox virus]AOP31435.1 toll/il-1 receptor-like protein [Raccoonpox virus]
MEIKIDISISGNKFTVTTNSKDKDTNMDKEKHMLHQQKNAVDITKTDYLEYDDLLDRDDMNNILKEYFMYRGLLGIRVKYGRLFNEIRKFDNVAEEQFGYIEELKEKLMLNSEEGAINFIDYVDSQKQDIVKLTVYDCMAMIGLCSLVLDVWRNARLFSRWKYCMNAIQIFIDDYMLDKIKTILQNRLVYVEMS